MKRITVPNHYVYHTWPEQRQRALFDVVRTFRGTRNIGRLWIFAAGIRFRRELIV